MKEDFKGINRVGVFDTIIAENSAYKRMNWSGMGVRELTENKRVHSDIVSLAIEIEGI